MKCAKERSTVAEEEEGKGKEEELYILFHRVARVNIWIINWGKIRLIGIGIEVTTFDLAFFISSFFKEKNQFLLRIHCSKDKIYDIHFISQLYLFTVEVLWFHLESTKLAPNTYPHTDITTNHGLINKWLFYLKLAILSI